MGAPTRSKADALPIHTLLESIDAWQRTPGKASQAKLAAGLGRLVEAYGATGARLEIATTSLRPLDVRVGAFDQVGEGRARPYHLRADDGRVILGELWLEGKRPQGKLAARTIESALAAAWAQAEAREAAKRLEALDAATRAIAAELSTERVLQLIVDRIRPLVGAQYAAIGIVDDAGEIEKFVTSGLSAAGRARIGDLPRGHGLLGLIIQENASFRIPDIATDPRRYGFPPRHPAMHSFLGVPVTVKGRSVGNLYLTNKRDAAEFTEPDWRLVETFALHAGIAIETARLHQEVQRLAVVEERERIGKDLHDGIIQSIYGVGLSLEDVPELMGEDPAEARARVDSAIDSLHRTIMDIRNFIFGLQPELLSGTTLLAGVVALCEEFRHNTTVDVDMRLPDHLSAEPSATITSEVLAVLNEALSNVARHSGATRATIEIVATASNLQLEVRDNGRGFPRAQPASLGHQGLRNMRERTQRVGGEFEIEGRPKRGTRIAVRVPITAQSGERRTG